MSHIFVDETAQDGSVGIFLAGKAEDPPMLLGTYRDDAQGFENEKGFIPTSTMPKVVVDWAVQHGWCRGNAQRVYFTKFDSALEMMHDFRAYMVEFGQLHYLAISVG